VINNLKARKVEVEEIAIVMAAFFDQKRAAVATIPSQTNRYKAANPSFFTGIPDTLKPWIRKVETHFPIATVSDPEGQFLVTTEFLSAAR
jgi:hypothetical protein